MWFTILIATLATSIYALPTELQNFLLVTTSQSDPSANSSDLTAVSATSLIDPFNQPALNLRLTAPGYNFLPNFTLADGTLSVFATAPFGGGIKLYNSTTIEAGKELQFLAEVQGTGNLALDKDYLLTVGGEKEGWTICQGALQNEVLGWNMEGETCRGTYVHAVTKAPY